MKKLFTSFAFLALAAMTFTACDKDKDACEEVACGVNAVCLDGNCLCDANYEKDTAGLCTVQARTKFLGSYSFDEACSMSGTTTGSATIANGGAVNEVKLSGLWYNTFSAGIIATVSGNNLSIARQTPDGDGYYVEGTGKIENGVVTLDLTITNEAVAENIQTNTCTWTLTK